MLLIGGLFLIVKGTTETHHMLEGHEEGAVGTITFAAAVTRVIFLDVVFALDGIITAVGMTDLLPADDGHRDGDRDGGDAGGGQPDERPSTTATTVKMLALTFLLLVGMALIADGLRYIRAASTLPRSFSAAVEALNLAAQAHKAPSGSPPPARSSRTRL